MHKTLYGIREFYIEAPVRHTGDHTLKDLTDAFGHILALLKLDGFALCFFRAALCCGTLDGHSGQDLIIMGDALLT